MLLPHMIFTMLSDSNERLICASDSHTPLICPWHGTWQMCFDLTDLIWIILPFSHMSVSSKPFSSLSIRLAHAAHLGFFLQKVWYGIVEFNVPLEKTRYINSLLLLLLLITTARDSSCSSRCSSSCCCSSRGWCATCVRWQCQRLPQLLPLTTPISFKVFRRQHPIPCQGLWLAHPTNNSRWQLLKYTVR